MSEQESSNGCNIHGPQEKCGHTTETCPEKNKEEAGQDSDSLEANEKMSSAERLKKMMAYTEQKAYKIISQEVEERAAYASKLVRDTARTILQNHLQTGAFRASLSHGKKIFRDFFKPENEGTYAGYEGWTQDDKNELFFVLFGETLK